MLWFLLIFLESTLLLGTDFNDFIDFFTWLGFSNSPCCSSSFDFLFALFSATSFPFLLSFSFSLNLAENLVFLICESGLWAFFLDEASLIFLTLLFNSGFPSYFFSSSCFASSSFSFSSEMSRFFCFWLALLFFSFLTDFYSGILGSICWISSWGFSS